jgi:hypothetical protein
MVDMEEAEILESRGVDRVESTILPSGRVDVVQDSIRAIQAADREQANRKEQMPAPTNGSVSPGTVEEADFAAELNQHERPTVDFQFGESADCIESLNQDKRMTPGLRIRA